MIDLVNRISDYESGMLDDEQVIALFQDMLNSGLVWQLQGSYGRTAHALLRAGLIHNKSPQALLRQHVSGAIQSGTKEAIAERKENA